MRIRIHDVPPFVCLNREHHPEMFLEVFVDLQFSATREPGNDAFYQVTIEEVQRGLLHHKGVTMALRYWVDFWLRTERLLTDWVHFPVGCCYLIEE